MTLDCGRDSAYSDALVGALAAEGVFVRKPFAAPGNRCIRVTTGPEDAIAIFAKALPKALARL